MIITKTVLYKSINKSNAAFTLIVTVRNSSCRKVMFSQVSVCPQGGMHGEGGHGEGGMHAEGGHGEEGVRGEGWRAW